MPATLKHLATSFVFAAAFLGVVAAGASAQDTTLQVTIKNGRFQPAELRAPVNKPVVIVVKNADKKAAEFESHALRVEKVIPANGQGSVRIRPQAPGRYDFFDDFNMSNRGVLIVE
jgi:hypothetical protein